MPDRVLPAGFALVVEGEVFQPHTGIIWLRVRRRFGAPCIAIAISAEYE